jgi:arylsulfatase A-like enzyme
MKNSINIIVFLFLGFTFNFASSQTPKKPNVVLIFTDDQRLQGTIHALGGTEVITPNIDALVKSGTSFTNNYIMGGTQGAVCTPSRNMLHTGRNLFSLGSVGADIMFPEFATLGETLGKNGYETFGIGKWHNDKASFNRSFQNGDEIFFGGMSKNPYNTGLFHYDKTGNYLQTNDIKNGDHANAKHHTEVFGDAAVKFIENYQTEKPFFLYMAFKSPHDPRIMPDKYKAMYDTSKISLPPNFMPRHPFNNGELVIRDEQLAATPRKPAEIKEHIRDYYAMMTHMDEQIGNVIQALKAKGIYEKTIIVFAGDNGLALGQHGLLGKQNVYEHSIKVPLIMVGNGIKKDKINTDFTYTFDIYPTICQLTGTEIPATVQGQSVFDKNAKKRETMLHAYRNVQRAIRKGDWKMIEYIVKSKTTVQLFNIKKDPWEMNNLAENSQLQSKLNELQTLLAEQKKIYPDFKYKNPQ